MLVGCPQDYELDIYLRQQWVDQRLRVAGGDPDQMLIVSRKSVIDQLWTPDLYFLNLKVRTSRVENTYKSSREYVYQSSRE